MWSSAHAFAATSTQHSRPAGKELASFWEVLDGGGGEIVQFLLVFADIGWSGATICAVVASTSKLYAKFQERIRYRDDAEY